MIFVRNWSENIITMSQRGNPDLELLASSHISLPQGQGLGIQLTLGGQSCMTRGHSSSWIRLCQQPESPTGLSLQWTSSTFSFCLYQMGWQQIRRSLAEIPWQIFSTLLLCFFLAAAPSKAPFLHYFFPPCKRPKRSTVCIQLKSWLIWRHSGHCGYCVLVHIWLR